MTETDASGPVPAPAPCLTVTGMDQSLASFGIAVASFSTVRLFRVRPKSRGHCRLQELLDAAMLHALGADLVAIEGLSYGSVSATAYDRAGLFWLIRHELWQAKIPYAVIPPATRAKWLTGKGNASKDECLAAAIKRFGHLADITGNDEADALTLAAMAHDAHGQPLVPMPQDRTALLHAKRTTKGHTGEPVIDWPQL
jgi:crossover junction endodeoxyribonuclease RuvC